MQRRFVYGSTVCPHGFRGLVLTQLGVVVDAALYSATLLAHGTSGGGVQWWPVVHLAMAVVEMLPMHLVQWQPVAHLAIVVVELLPMHLQVGEPVEVVAVAVVQATVVV